MGLITVKFKDGRTRQELTYRMLRESISTESISTESISSITLQEVLESQLQVEDLIAFLEHIKYSFNKPDNYEYTSEKVSL
jgi:hypothetical protein